jgi:folylpolyglutamate synthase/dihydropteroate synthase
VLAEQKDALLVIAGSLYLVGDVLRLLRNAGGEN